MAYHEIEMNPTLKSKYEKIKTFSAMKKSLSEIDSYIASIQSQEFEGEVKEAVIANLKQIYGTYENLKEHTNNLYEALGDVEKLRDILSTLENETIHHNELVRQYNQAVAARQHYINQRDNNYEK